MLRYILLCVYDKQMSDALQLAVDYDGINCISQKKIYCAQFYHHFSCVFSLHLFPWPRKTLFQMDKESSLI